MATRKSDDKRRTNQRWLADLKGANGIEMQEAAYIDLGRYAAACAYNMLRRKAGNLAALSDLDDSTLRDYAVDFAQATLEKIAAGDGELLDQYRGQAAFTSWVAKIANRLVLAELRKATYRSEVSLAPTQREEFNENERLDTLRWRQSVLLGQFNRGPEEITQRRELASAIASCIDELPEREQAAFWAKEVDGHSGQTIARELETTRNAVYILLSTARQRLQACLQAEGFA